jgi:excisionase family DNA binding protein
MSEPTINNREAIMDEILDLDEVAAILKVSKRTVQREVGQGRLEAFHVGRALRFRKEAVEAYIGRQRVQPGERVDEGNQTDEAA